jgi:hypothetical protein
MQDAQSGNIHAATAIQHLGEAAKQCSCAGKSGKTLTVKYLPEKSSE